MTDPEAPETVGRRGLLGRTAALAAGTAAGALALGAAGSRSAEADSGDTLLADRFNYAESITWLTKRNAYDNQPTLQLANAQGGPALKLDNVAEDVQLSSAIEPGGFFTIAERPVYAAGEDGKAFSVGLATLDDVDLLQRPEVSAPFRILDTTKSYPGQVRDTRNFDDSGRLRAGRSVDLNVGPAFDDVLTLHAVFLNVHSSGATENGVLAVHPPSERKEATLHFAKGVAVANFTVTPVVRLPDFEGNPAYFVRVYTSATTHVQVDFLGSISDRVSPEPGAGLPHRIRRPRSAARRITSRLRSPR